MLSVDTVTNQPTQANSNAFRGKKPTKKVVTTLVNKSQEQAPQGFLDKLIAKLAVILTPKSILVPSFVEPKGKYSYWRTPKGAMEAVLLDIMSRPSLDSMEALRKASLESMAKIIKNMKLNANFGKKLPNNIKNV